MREGWYARPFACRVLLVVTEDRMRNSVRDRQHWAEWPGSVWHVQEQASRKLLREPQPSVVEALRLASDELNTAQGMPCMGHGPTAVYGATNPSARCRQRIASRRRVLSLQRLGHQSWQGNLLREPTCEQGGGADRDNDQGPRRRVWHSHETRMVLTIPHVTT